MIVADEVGAAELDQPRDGLADDDRAEVPDVHLLGGVRRRVVDDDLASAHQTGRAGAPLGLVTILTEPGPEGGGRELEVDEARAGDLHLHGLVVQPALGADGFDERRGEGARIGLRLLRRRKHAVGLEVSVTGIGGLQLGIEAGAEGWHGLGGAPQEGVELTRGIEPDGHDLKPYAAPPLRQAKKAG